MNGTQLRVVTVSREFGAGGGAFAKELGGRLGWPVLDHDIVRRVAERLRMDEETVEHFDEHPPSLLARIAGVLVIPQPDLMEFPPVEGVPSHDQIAHASTRVIRDAAASPPLVVVGHGSQCILAGRPDALHVFLHAPFEARVRRIVERLHVDAAVAPALVRRADHERRAYVQRYFHANWRDALLYDLQIGTAKVTTAEAATLAERLIRGRMPAPDAGARTPGPQDARSG